MTLDQLIDEFLRRKGLGPDAPVPDEVAFYQDFIRYTFFQASGGRQTPPSHEALMGGFLKSKGLSPDTPVAPGGEAAFYEQFALWVYEQGGKAPRPPVENYGPGERAPVRVSWDQPERPDTMVQSPAFWNRRGPGGGGGGGGGLGGGNQNGALGL